MSKRKKPHQTTKNTKKKKEYDVVEYRGDSCYEKEYTWYSFFNEFCVNHNTDIDENFQSPPRWLEATKFRYLKSASKQFTSSSSIVVYDIDSGLDYCKRMFLQTDVEYLEDWKSRGVKYLVIDGNNKRWTIVGYIGNTLKMSFDLKYMNQTLQIRNKTFAELQTDPTLFAASSWLGNLPIKVIVYTNISLTECGEMFVEINKGGVKLNSQEERNSSYNYTAVSIRALKDEYKDKIKNRHTDAKYNEMINRRGLDEAVAKCFLSGFSNMSKFGGKELDKMYEANLLASDYAKYQKFEKIIEDALEIYSLTNLKNSPGEILHIFNLLLLLTNSGYRLNYQYSKMYQEFANWYSEFVVKHSGTTIGRHSNQDGTMAWLKTLAHKNTITLISGFTYDMLLDDSSTKLLYKEENNAKRIASRYQRYVAWVKQQVLEIDPVSGLETKVSRCPLTNKIIPADEIYDAKKWSADHPTRYVDGGNDYQLIDFNRHLEKTISENKSVREFGEIVQTV
jgi:hypothetical protein